MSTYYYAINSDGDYLFDNFPNNSHDLFDNFPNNSHDLITNYKESSKPFQIKIDGNSLSARIGKKSNSHGTIYTLTTEFKYVNRIKLFKELVDFSIISLKPLESFHKKIVQLQTEKTEELIHNITSLNTYSIQDLFALIPQKSLSENINTQKDIIKSAITEKPNVTIST